MSNGRTLLEGFAFKLKSKKPKFGKPWNKRWFTVQVLNGGSGKELVLCYFTKKGAYDPNGWIFLREITDILYSGDFNKVSHEVREDNHFGLEVIRKTANGFIITAESRNFFLNCDSYLYTRMWVEGLRRITGMGNGGNWPSSMGPPPKAVSYLVAKGKEKGRYLKYEAAMPKKETRRGEKSKKGGESKLEDAPKNTYRKLEREEAKKADKELILDKEKKRERFSYDEEDVNGRGKERREERSEERSKRRDGREEREERRGRGGREDSRRKTDISSPMSEGSITEIETIDIGDDDDDDEEHNRTTADSFSPAPSPHKGFSSPKKTLLYLSEEEEEDVRPASKLSLIEQAMAHKAGEAPKSIFDDLGDEPYKWGASSGGTPSVTSYAPATPMKEEAKVEEGGYEDWDDGDSGDDEAGLNVHTSPKAEESKSRDRTGGVRADSGFVDEAWDSESDEEEMSGERDNNIKSVSSAPHYDGSPSPRGRGEEKREEDGYEAIAFKGDAGVTTDENWLEDDWDSD